MAEPILGFSKETFARRRALVHNSLQDGILILPSGPLLFRSRDIEHRYRPDSELFYLTGCTEPQVVAVFLGKGGGDAFILFVSPRDSKAEVWSGPRLGPQEAKGLFGADAVYPLDDLKKKLPALLESPRRVFFRFGVHPTLERLVVDALRTARSRGTRKGIGPRAVEDPGQLLDGPRLRKDAEEISKIRRAAALTVEAFRGAIGGIRSGMGEWEVESLLESGFRRGGAQGPAFPTIVGSGENACTLHYSENRHAIGKGDLVLLDGGAEVDLYAGDVTRTFPAGGSFNESQRGVYEMVLRAHQAALEVVRPGRTVGQLHEAAVFTLTEGLLELGVLSGDVEELIQRKAYERYFPHQTSHWLGLDVHDVGDYAGGGESQLLEPGMVLTVEPGLYFPSTDGQKPNPFDGIGVRIEDDILVTADGAENLTEALPVLPDEIQALVGSA